MQLREYHQKNDDDSLVMARDVATLYYDKSVSCLECSPLFIQDFGVADHSTVMKQYHSSSIASSAYTFTVEDNRYPYDGDKVDLLNDRPLGTPGITPFTCAISNAAAIALTKFRLFGSCSCVLAHSIITQRTDSNWNALLERLTSWCSVDMTILRGYADETDMCMFTLVQETVKLLLCQARGEPADHSVLLPARQGMYCPNVRYC